MSSDPQMEKCRQELFEAISKRSRDYLTLARLLHQAHCSNRKRGADGSLRWSGKNYLQKWGYWDLGDFSEKELGISYRTAKTYVDIWEAVEKFDLPVNLVGSIDRSKMALVMQVMDPYNCMDLLEVAQSRTVWGVKSHVNMLKGVRDPEYVELVIPKKSLVYKAIQAAKRKMNISSDLDALAHILHV